MEPLEGEHADVSLETSGASNEARFEAEPYCMSIEVRKITEQPVPEATLPMILEEDSQLEKLVTVDAQDIFAHTLLIPNEIPMSETIAPAEAGIFDEINDTGLDKLNEKEKLELAC